MLFERIFNFLIKARFAKWQACFLFALLREQISLHSAIRSTLLCANTSLSSCVVVRESRLHLQ